MMSKKLLYLAIVLGILVSVGAIPAMADGETSMWVHRARLAYTGRSSGGTDAMKAYIHIRDTNLKMVIGATVTATWVMPDGKTETEHQVTNRQGIAIFSVWEGRGEYSICVEDVTKAGWLYDPDLNRETCATLNPRP